VFNNEFEGLPSDVEQALRRRLEDVVRMINNRYQASLRDASVRNYTSEQLSGMISTIFDVAARLKPFSALDLEKE
jgi:hypothetical protein